jgi:hypothetical protein
LVSVLCQKREERYDDTVLSDTKILYAPNGSILGTPNVSKGSYPKEIVNTSELGLGDNIISYLKPVMLNKD